MNRYQVTDWCHGFIKEHVEPGDICIDATAGNGSDTAYLCGLLKGTGKVYAFDIQEQAVIRTRERIKDAACETEVILSGHENMARYIKEAGEVSCIVFNFGYLPGGDHAMATKGETSIAAMEAGLALLKAGGIMSLCIYSGGDSGFEEKDAVLAWLRTLDSKRFLVIVSEYYNRPNHPPIPAFVVKLGNS